MKKLLLLIASMSVYSILAMDPTTPTLLRLTNAAHPKKPLPKSSQKWFNAVRSCNTEKMYAMLQQGFDANTKDQTDATALHIAVTESDSADTDMVALLLNHHANPNAQDENDNTPLHYVLATAQKNLSAIMVIESIIDRGLEPIVQKYTAICKQPLENANGRINQYDVNARNQKLERLEARGREIHEKAAPTINRIKEQLQKCLDTAIILVACGARTNIRNKSNQTIAHQYPQFLETIRNTLCVHAIMADKEAIVMQCLREGVHPECVLDNKRTLLCLTLECNAPKSARVLLCHGAQLATFFELGRGELTALHVVADTKNIHMLDALLESPQGSPSAFSNIHDLRKAQQEIFTFLCCVKRAESNIPSMGEVQHNICKFLLPDPARLIDEVPLEQLPQYLSLKVFGKSFFNKDAIINTLTERHLEVVGNALLSKAHFAPPLDGLNVPPHQFARIMAGPNGNISLGEPNEISKLLDPDENPLESCKEAIKANYTKLLE